MSNGSDISRPAAIAR